MNHIGRGPKKPVNMTLDAELVREARLLTRNLSETVEQLLAGFVEEERRRREIRERGIDEAIMLANAHYDKHGLCGEEFSPL
jgi:antitoxin CcdA